MHVPGMVEHEVTMQSLHGLTVFSEKSGLAQNVVPHVAAQGPVPQAHAVISALKLCCPVG